MGRPFKQLFLADTMPHSDREGAMRRREFTTLIAGAAVLPYAAQAQQPAPVVGFLGVTSTGTQPYLAAFRQGLSETGYVEGQNVVIEYRWAEDQYNRLPDVAVDLIRHHVSVIATLFTTSAAAAAKATTSTIPIVFSIGDDPVKHGLVASLSRPGGNATGINFFSAEVTAKRLGLLRELLPRATRIGVLVNPTDVEIAERTVKDVNAAAGPLGLQVQVLNASNGDELDAAFTTLVSGRADGLLVGPNAFFVSRRVQIAILAARHMMPAIYTISDYADAGGLISYGTDVADSVRQQGIYVGRILKGTKPADLPVLQATTFKFVINLRTAKALGLQVPATLLSRADEVIE
jgi:putative ABC transport system substrate-binding protein